MNNQDIKDKNQEITKTETWLRDHSHADWQVRHDMIKKLADLKSELEINK